MKSIKEMALDIIACYEGEEGCEAMVANAVRIVKERGGEVFEVVESNIDEEKGKLYIKTGELKASIKVRSLSDLVMGGCNVGRCTKNLREDSVTGEIYAVGFRGSFIFAEV